MNPSVLSILFLFGGLQAILMIIGINIKRPLGTAKQQATTLLLSTIVLAMLYYVTIVSKWSTLYSYTWMIGNVAWMSIAPAYYLFIRSVVDENFRFSSSTWKYLTPTVLFTIEGLLYYIAPNYAPYNVLDSPQLYMDLWIVLFVISGLTYCALAYDILKNVDRHPLQKQLKLFTSIFVAIVVIYAIIFVVIRKNYHLAFEVSMIILFEILIFVMVFRMFRVTPRAFFAEPRYENTQLASRPDLLDLRSTIDQALISQELFKEPKLTLAQLAKASGIGPNKLSEFFNVILDTSFYQYVNSARLDHIEQLIRNGKHEQITINALAQEGGFNSKTTFYKAFRTRHEMTPSEYIREVG